MDPISWTWQNLTPRMPRGFVWTIPSVHSTAKLPGDANLASGATDTLTVNMDCDSNFPFQFTIQVKDLVTGVTVIYPMQSGSTFSITRG